MYILQYCTVPTYRSYFKWPYFLNLLLRYCQRYPLYYNMQQDTMYCTKKILKNQPNCGLFLQISCLISENSEISVFRYAQLASRIHDIKCSPYIFIFTNLFPCLQLKCCAVQQSGLLGLIILIKCAEPLNYAYTVCAHLGSSGTGALMPRDFLYKVRVLLITQVYIYCQYSHFCLL